MKRSMLGVMVAAGLFAAQAQAQFEARNLRAVPTGSGLDVTWEHPTEEFARIGYDVFATPVGRGTAGGEFSRDGVGRYAITPVIYRNLTPGTDYEVQVASQPSGAVGGSVTITVRTLGQRPFAPDVPNPTCSFANGSLTVTWPSVHYATNYESNLRSEPRGGTLIADLGSGTATTRTYSDPEDLQSGTTYFVDVRAGNNAGRSNWGVCSFTTSDTETPTDPTTPTDPETPTDPTTPTQRVCEYEHRLNTVPGSTQSYSGWIRVTSRVAGGSVGIRAYQQGDGSSLDVLDEEGAVVGSTTGVGPANSTQRFHVQEATGWHSVVVSHGITANDMNGVMVSMVLRGPQGLQVIPAHVAEHCRSVPITTQAN